MHSEKPQWAIGISIGAADWLELKIDDDTVLRIPRDRIQWARQEASFQARGM